MVRKTTISSVLSQDFGIEDFTSGVVQNYGSESVASYDLSNKLGLLAPLADRYNTDPMNFGAEAYDLLGESKQINQFVENQLDSINQRFAIAVEMKKNFGIEGFDPFAFGAEGFKEKVKSAFTGIVAVIKKIIQSITNWIRSVLNWIGSQFAKLQQKLIDKYGNMTPVDNGVMIKAAVPLKPVTSGKALIEGYTEGIRIWTKLIRLANNLAMEVVVVNGDVAMKKEMAKGISTQMTKENNRMMDDPVMKSYYGKKIEVLKLGAASKSANMLVFGTEKLEKITISGFKYLERVGNWKVLLSRGDLDAANEMVKYGKAIIKLLNDSLKNTDKLIKSLKIGGVEKNLSEDKKSLNMEVRNSRNVLKILTRNNRISSLMTGTLFGMFANYLKLRSYTASAVRAVFSTYGKKDPKKGSKEDFMKRAYNDTSV